jgi:uncharacterized protein (DUF983 family)
MPPPPWWQAALTCRCPRCGMGNLYQRLPAVRPASDRCGRDLSAHGSGCGPAALIAQQFRHRASEMGL